ncbi:MAG: DNA recombination protein RmuC [Armatimonadetes bacterium]|nr:DNA recombination protein RmuC [Armatimonadota bacterium]
MGTAVALIVGVAVGLVIGRLLASGRCVAAETRLAEATRQLGEQKASLDDLGAQLTQARQDLARLEEANRQLAEQKKLLDDAKTQLGDAFKALSSEALDTSSRRFLELASQALGRVTAEARGDIEKRQEAIDALIKPLQDALTRYEAQILGMEEKRRTAYGRIDEQLQGVTSAQQQLQRETANLVTALRRPEVRGRWGEMTLRRVLEIAGMTEHCDFDIQPSVSSDEGLLRPDCIVRLPGGRTIVVDSKTPLDAYASAVEATDDASRNAALRDHAAQVRGHIRKLQQKAYHEQLDRTPDFTVLFLPAESLFSAALEQERDLIEVGAKSKVLIATPTTLIALFLSVAQSWHEERFIENAQEIAKVSKEFFARVSTFAGHLGRIRDGLARASEAYNAAVGSWQGPVVRAGRKVAELGGAEPGKDAPDLELVEVQLRELPLAESAPADTLAIAEPEAETEPLEPLTETDTAPPPPV